VTTTDTTTLTALFAAFAATMAWAEMFTRQYTAACASAGTSGQRRRHPF